MKHAAIALLAALPLLFVACKKEEEGPTIGSSVRFMTDAGYTFAGDTVPRQDTLLVGVVITPGSDRPHHFKITVSYDGGSFQTTDSIRLGSTPIEFEKRIYIRNQVGTELWRFNIVENDGDVVRRSMLFHVQ